MTRVPEPDGPERRAVDRAGHRRIILAVSLTVVTSCALAYAVDPRGIGGVLYVAACTVLILAITVGPLARGVRPRRIWIPQTMAGICLLLSLLGEVVTLRIGPIGYTDITYFGGYVLLLLWLVLLSRHVGRRGDRSTLLDSAAAAVGVSLAFWSSVLAPLVGDSQLSSGLVGAVYPTVDVVLLAASVHLALRFEARVPAMAWLIPSLVLQLAVDTVYSLTPLVAPQADLAPITACYLFCFFGLAVAATHPSVVDLSRRPTGRNSRGSAGRGTAVAILAVFPAILSTALPVTGVVDTLVRTTLIASLLTLLLTRLARTLAALSRAEAASHHRATHDDLTGLLNRAAMLDALDHLLDRNAREGGSTAVLFIDCDDFKHVNDTWGHHAGDTLLRDVATRLPEHLRPSDVLARHGGDEFVVLTSVDDLDEAAALAERVRRFFDDPLRILPGRVHAVTASVGLALAGPGERTTTEDLLGRADIAMYEAKKRERGRYVVFDDELAQRTGARAPVGDRLDAAIRDDVFGLRLQPIMGGECYATLVGWEALARWWDPELGDVSPEVFIPLAEELGLITDLGHIVLRRACRDLARLRETFADDELAVFVNVSPAQLLQPGFAAVVRDVLGSTGLPGHCLRLEVTETLLVDQGPAVLDTLHELREAGVRICLDDFGTGYASLATLLRLPVDCVKLDRSLTARLDVHAEAPRQLRAVIDLVNSLGIEQVVAEGVETTRQEGALRELGCPMVQGWLYGRPSTTESWLSARGAVPR